MGVIVHLSDLHFGRHDRNMVRSLLKYLDALGPDLIVITGDLTQRATTVQYDLAKKFLDQLPKPLVVVPGNHDLPIHRLLRRFRHPWLKWKKIIGSDPSPVFQKDRLAVAGINTVRPMGDGFNWSRGRVTIDQSMRAVKKIATAPENAVKIIAAHHAFWLPDLKKHRRLVGGAGDALEVFRQAGVDMILGGHIHLPFVHVENGMIICHAGSAISNRVTVAHPNSFNLILGGSMELEGLEIRQMEWHKNKFFCADSFKFIRTSLGWLKKE